MKQCDVGVHFLSQCGDQSVERKRKRPPRPFDKLESISQAEPESILSFQYDKAYIFCGLFAFDKLVQIRHMSTFDLLTSGWNELRAPSRNVGLYRTHMSPPATKLRKIFHIMRLKFFRSISLI